MNLSNPLPHVKATTHLGILLWLPVTTVLLHALLLCDMPFSLQIKALMDPCNQLYFILVHYSHLSMNMHDSVCGTIIEVMVDIQFVEGHSIIWMNKVLLFWWVTWQGQGFLETFLFHLASLFSAHAN